MNRIVCFALLCVLGANAHAQLTGAQLHSDGAVYVPQPDLRLRCDQPIPPPVQPERYSVMQGWQSLTLQEEVVDSVCPGDYTILRQWGFASGGGGFDVVATRRIDIEPIAGGPIISGPQVVALADPYSFDYEANPTVEVTACGDYTLTADLTFVIPSNSPWAGQCGMELIWTLSDACGGSTEFVQIVVPTACDAITIGVINVSECEDPTACNYGGPLSPWSGEENCVYPETPGENCYANSFLCTGGTTADYMMVSGDVTPPEIWGVPEASAAVLGTDSPLLSLSIGAADNTGLPVTLAFERQTLSSDACGQQLEEVLITAEDVCGNITTASFLHTLQLPPPLQIDVALELIEPTVVNQSDYGNIDWWSVNPEKPTEYRRLSFGGLLNGYPMEVVEDRCGHRQTIDYQVYQFFDDVPPPISMPADITLACPPASVDDPVLGTPSSGEGNWAPFGIAVTMEAYAYEVDLTLDTLALNGPGDFVLQRTASATDNAGNTATATQTITVRDTIPPVLNFPDTMYFDDEWDLEMMDISFDAEDNCDGMVYTTWEMESLCGGCDEIWHLTATDAAGNMATHELYVSFADCMDLHDDGACCDPVGDLNEDGLVGASDLLLLLAGFGEGCD